MTAPNLLSDLVPVNNTQTIGTLRSPFKEGYFNKIIVSSGAGTNYDYDGSANYTSMDLPEEEIKGAPAPSPWTSPENFYISGGSPGYWNRSDAGNRPGGHLGIRSGRNSYIEKPDGTFAETSSKPGIGFYVSKFGTDHASADGTATIKFYDYDQIMVMDNNSIRLNRSFIPYNNKTVDLGSSSYYFNNGYIANLKGNADTATNASKVGNCSVETSLTTTSDTKIPTSKAIADFVAASTECGDNYIKFPNGVAICWGSYTGSENLSFTAWGNSYKATSSKQVTFPITFGITPSVILSPSTSANDYTITKYSCSKTGFGNLSISKATSSSGAFDVAFNYVAVGSTLEHYDVTYDTSGGVSIASDLKRAGVTVTVPSTSKTGYTLSGWTSNQVTVSKSGDTYTFVMPEMNVTLTASWLGNSHTVTYNTDGGSSISSESKRTGDSVTIPATTKANYTLTGWTSSQVTITKSGSSYVFTMPNSDVTVKATWVYQLAGNIMYSLNGGSAQTLPSTLSLKTTDSVTFSYSFTNSSYKPANPTYTWSYGGSVVSTSATYTPALAVGTGSLALTINGVSVGASSLIIAQATTGGDTSDYRTIGGAIFYDAGDNGATYTFYDESKNIISDTSISGLQSAKYYKVSGTPSTDRFYAVYPTRLNNGSTAYWGFYYNADIKSSSGNIVNTGTAVGTGKTATQAILNYIDTYASGETASATKPSSDISQSSHSGYNLYKNCGASYNYLWDVFRDWKSTSPEGLDDWFIPSKDELNQIASNASIISPTAPEISEEVNNGYIWSSSAYSSSRRAWYWYYDGSRMGNGDRIGGCRVVACRAF